MSDHPTTLTSPGDSPEQPTSQPDLQSTPRPATARHEAPRTWFRKTRFALPLSVAVAFGIIMISTGGNDPGIIDRTQSVLESQAEGEITVQPATATIGQSVRDGGFAFMVTSVQQAGATISDRSGRTQTAQGVFVIVRVRVSNTGYEARPLAATHQFLISDTHQRFATSSAVSSLTNAERVFVEKVNPGSHVYEAPLLFDVPPGTTLASVELHDALSSAGVKVRLR